MMMEEVSQRKSERNDANANQNLNVSELGYGDSAREEGLTNCSNGSILKASGNLFSASFSVSCCSRFNLS